MINFNYVTKENSKEDNLNWPQIPDHPSSVLIIRESGSRTANAWFNLIGQPPELRIHMMQNTNC